MGFISTILYLRNSERGTGEFHSVWTRSSSTMVREEEEEEEEEAVALVLWCGFWCNSS